MDEQELQRRREIFGTMKLKHEDTEEPEAAPRRRGYDWWLDQATHRNCIWPEASRPDRAEPLTKCNGMSAQQVAAWVQEYLNLKPVLRLRPIRRGPEADLARIKRIKREMRKGGWRSK